MIIHRLFLISSQVSGWKDCLELASHLPSFLCHMDKHKAHHSGKTCRVKAKVEQTLKCRRSLYLSLFKQRSSCHLTTKEKSCKLLISRIATFIHIFRFLQCYFRSQKGVICQRLVTVNSPSL